MANQILFLGKFECRLCREKQFKQLWCKQRNERNTVTRSFASFRKRSNSRWLLLKEQCDQVTRGLLIGPQASLPNTRCAALFWGTCEVSLRIWYKSLQERFPCRRQTHLGNDWAMKIAIVEPERTWWFKWYHWNRAHLFLLICQPCFPFLCLYVSLMQTSSKWPPLVASVLRFPSQGKILPRVLPRVPAIAWVLHLSVNWPLWPGTGKPSIGLS